MEILAIYHFVYPLRRFCAERVSLAHKRAQRSASYLVDRYYMDKSMTGSPRDGSLSQVAKSVTPAAKAGRRANRMKCMMMRRRRG